MLLLMMCSFQPCRALGTGDGVAATDATSKAQFDALVSQDVRPAASPTFAEVKTTTGAPTAAGTGVTIDTPALTLRRVVLTFVNTPVPLVDNAGVVAYGSVKVMDFPEGVIVHMGCVASFTVTKSSAGVNADWDGDFSVGTVAANSGASLTGTEADILASTATPQAVAGTTTAKGHAANTELSKTMDGHTTAVDVYVNFLVDDADHDVTTTPCNLILNGTLTLTYYSQGDYTG